MARSRKPKLRWAAWTLAALIAIFPRGGLASDQVTVPIGLQAELLVKVAGYDRALSSRVTDGALRIGIVISSANSDSVREASQLALTLADFKQIAGYSHVEENVAYANARALAETCRRRRIAILYLTNGLRDELPAIREALDGVNVMTVASVADYVSGGIVLGFDLVTGKPKLLVNLSQAQKQHVDLRAQLLQLATVIR